MLTEALTKLYDMGAMTVAVDLHHDGRHDVVVTFKDGRTCGVYAETTFEAAVHTVVARVEEFGWRR